MKEKRLMLIQPILADYRIYFFNKLSEKFEVKLFCGQASKNAGFDISSKVNFKVVNTSIITFFNEKLYYQKGLIKGVLNFRPDYIFITAHPKNISLWVVLLFSKCLRIKTYIHGQGFYNKPKGGFFLHFTYKLMFMLCHKYVCYTESSRESFKNLPQWCRDKCFVADNTIYNEHALSNRQKKYDKNGVLYIGRIRKGANVDLLAKAVIELNQEGKNITLHIIGGGEYEIGLKEQFHQFEYIKFYGKIYDQKEITKISKHCFIGCYPGQAGLSVVHYMSLALPALIHADLTQHMGPEPSYVKHNVNGFMFNNYSIESMAQAIDNAYLIRESTKYEEIGNESFQTYSRLINPDFSDKLISAIEGN